MMKAGALSLLLAAVGVAAQDLPPISFTTFTVRAKNEVEKCCQGTAQIALKVGNQVLEDFNTGEAAIFDLTDELKNYKVLVPTRDLNGEADLVVESTNDNDFHNAVVEWVKIDNSSADTVDKRLGSQWLNTGAYTEGAGCGVGLSKQIACPGVINFGGVFSPYKKLTLQARGWEGSEQVVVSVADEPVAKVKLGTTAAKYVMRTTKLGEARVEFVNDRDGATAVVVDWLKVNTQKRKANQQAENTGAFDASTNKCATLPKKPTIECPGYINFGDICLNDDECQK